MCVLEGKWFIAGRIMFNMNHFFKILYNYVYSFLLLGQLYGLEKFWAYLKYSQSKTQSIDPKLQEYLCSFKRLEDFRVDVSFKSFPLYYYFFNFLFWKFNFPVLKSNFKAGIKIVEHSHILFYLEFSNVNILHNYSAIVSSLQFWYVPIVKL